MNIWLVFVVFVGVFKEGFLGYGVYFMGDLVLVFLWWLGLGVLWLEVKVNLVF